MTTSLVQSARYVILREQQEYGPFSKETLTEAMNAGNLVAEDWVRTIDRTACWRSLGQLLYGPPEPESPVVRMHRMALQGIASASELGARWLSTVSRVLDICSNRLENRLGFLALVSVMVATGIVLLPERPLAVSAPWIMAAVAGGVAMILRRRSFRGAIVCLAAVFIPLITFKAAPMVAYHLDPNRRESSLPPIGEMYSSMPRKSLDAHKRHPPAVSGVPALGLPQPAFAEE
jgi:hypothetical protein